jgi:DNA repair protein RadA
VKEFKLSDLEGVGPVAIQKLEKVGIKNPLDVVIRGAKEFSRISGISPDTAAKHLRQMKVMLAESGIDIEVRDTKSLKALRANQIRVPFKVEELDEMSKGGFETQSLYEVYGDEGSGKTQMSMTAAAEYLRAGHGVLFIDCEGAFDIERFEEICEVRGIEYDEEKLRYHMCSDESELERDIQSMSPELIEHDVRLVVIDGLVGLMRLAFEGRGELGERQTELKGIMKYLRNMSILLNLSIVITNQVTANPDGFGAKVKPIGGHILGHYVKYIYWISKGMKNNRVVKLVKSPNSPQGEYKCFLNEEGVSQYEKLTNKIKEKRMNELSQEDTQGLIMKDTLLEPDNDKVKVY